MKAESDGTRPGMAAAADTARLFFAAWPSPEVQRALHAVAQRARRECGGRPVAEPNIHLTLIFLGEVERARLRELEAIAGEINGSACDLVVEHLAYWRHNGILWAGVDRCPDALRELVEALSAGLLTFRLRLDDRPYVPHITLLRKVRRGPAVAAIPAIAWPVHDFALIESAPSAGGRTYSVLRSWPLS